jgi:hypothetical protein
MYDAMQKHSTYNTEHSECKYTYFENTHTFVKKPTHYTTPTHITKQVQTATVQDIHQMK